MYTVCNVAKWMTQQFCAMIQVEQSLQGEQKRGWKQVEPVHLDAGALREDYKSRQFF